MTSPFYPSFSTTPSSSTSLVVTREEFNAFHSIDRTLFTRLAFVLNRDMNQTFQVIAFLLLLEQTGYARSIVAYLVSLPNDFIDAVANEIGVCLSLLYNLDLASTFFVATNSDDNSIIPLLMRLTGERFTLKLIHQNREIYRVGLAKNLNDICNRAFEDLRKCTREKFMANLEREKLIENLRNIRLSVQQETNNRLSVQQATMASPPPPPPPVKEVTYKDIRFGNVILEKKEDEPVVAVDDRTVFLTFSKGYPISEEEVRVYFTRRLGDVIEAIEMQEVEGYEQPLYARMVLKMRCASMMDEIVSARTRNKFTINGKHVWARKYVRKNLPSVSSSSYI